MTPVTPQASAQCRADILKQTLDGKSPACALTITHSGLVLTTWLLGWSCDPFEVINEPGMSSLRRPLVAETFDAKR